MFSLVKNNWKKLLFVTTISGYGFYSLKSYVEESVHMRKICNEVLEHQSFRMPPRKILVILNPAATKKRTDQMFKKYCEPILHLAGCSVTIFRTNYVGHAKTFIEKLNQLPDAIVVAGGQGTSSEVVTGLLRRVDVPCPLLFLPLGETKKFELSNIGSRFAGKLKYVEMLTKSAASLIHNQMHYENVLRYDVVDSEKNEKPIYGLHKFSWGVMRDVNALKDNYWYFGYLRNYAAIIFNAFSNELTSEFGTNYAFTPPCPGCTHCSIDSGASKNGSFIQRLVKLKINDNSSNNSLNEHCVKKESGYVQTCQVDITCKKNQDKFYELETKFNEKILSGFDILKHTKNIINDEMEQSLVLRSRTLELYPCDYKEHNSFYTIDGEEYTTRPIKVSLIQNAIRVYNHT